MAEETKIGWADATWSPWRGCVKVSEGCANCYAEKGAKRNPKVLGEWGPDDADGRRVVNADWDAPRRWAERAAEDGRRLVLFPSLCDPFEDWPGVMMDHHGNVLDPDGQPATEDHPGRLMEMQDVRRRFCALIEQTKAGAVWTLLTKRPENAVRLSSELARPAWLVASAENQKWHDRRAWHLACAAPYFRGTGWSIEPQLGPIRLKSVCVVCESLQPVERLKCGRCGRATWRPGWVIIGGESGPGARPWFVYWGMDLVKQCQTAGIPVFFKQMGTRPMAILSDLAAESAGRKDAEIRLKHPKGEDPAEWPSGLHVQQFPEWGAE